MRFIDLFSGIGGFRIALESLGWECVFSSEIDPRARECYQEYFNAEVAGDIRGVKASDIPDHELLCAGFPCQSFSISGNRRGLRDPRGLLFQEILRIANAKNTPRLLLENVPHLLSIDGGAVIEKIVQALDGIGYKHIQIKLLNSSHFGIPHSRKRVYILCDRQVGLDNDIVPPMDKVWLGQRMLPLGGVPDDCFIKRDDIVIERVVKRHKLAPIRIGYLSRCMKVGRVSQGGRIYSPNGHAVCITSVGGGLGAKTGLYLTGDRVRRLSAWEVYGLMNWPLEFMRVLPLTSSETIRLLGNAVIPCMIEVIMEAWY